MGSGVYCSTSRLLRATSLGYDTKSASEIFTARSVNNAMSPNGLGVRESRDSAEHPRSLAIVLALDVTGSMGSIPMHLVREGLPKVMAGMLQHGVSDPQVLFLGVGDHECDKAPLQVGQFESSDELLDKWLTTLFLEGGGGGNAGESYHLAWLVAADHTDIDCLKRGQKGFLFTIGDEPVLPGFPARAAQNILGTSQPVNRTAAELLDAAREKYHVYHLHLRQGTNGRRQDVIDGWKQLMGSENLIVVDRHEDIPNVIANIVASKVTVFVPESSVPDLAKVEDPVAEPVTPDITSGIEEML